MVEDRGDTWAFNVDPEAVAPGKGLRKSQDLLPFVPGRGTTTSPSEWPLRQNGASSR